MHCDYAVGFLFTLSHLLLELLMFFLTSCCLHVLLKLLGVLFSPSCVSCCLCCLWLIHTKWSAALCCHGNWRHVHNAFSLIVHYELKIVFLRSVFNFLCWELNALSLFQYYSVGDKQRFTVPGAVHLSLCGCRWQIGFCTYCHHCHCFWCLWMYRGLSEECEAKNTHSVPYMAPLAFSVCLFVCL